ncbi:hypothetical protein scyTo_0013249 [Scyliorhinus torazame]|uniref:Uncharacterized protein n=1 Tax=Scyliorhinus torazame TaxID=75743 RepID=A0A401NSH0_SCYTO|nr:hypothetical protein [Scyliorhinus torazame]
MLTMPVLLKICVSDFVLSLDVEELVEAAKVEEIDFLSVLLEHSLGLIRKEKNGEDDCSVDIELGYTFPY